MKHKSIITISNFKGSRVIHLGSRTKLGIAAIFICFFITIFIGIFDWYSLRQKVSLMQKSYKLEQEEYAHFSAFINELTQQINQQNAAFSELEKAENFTDSKKETENPNSSIEEKINANATKHSLLQRNLMLQNIPNGYPFAKAVNISSLYGNRIHPLTKTEHFHAGIDFSAGYKKEILATAAGIVESVDYDPAGYGKMIRIRHNFGFSTLYAHLETTKVKPGSSVNKGDLIALSGNSGLSTSPHLHYEIHYLNKTLNPIAFVQWNLSNYSSIFTKVQEVKWSKLMQNVKQKIAMQEPLLSPMDPKSVVN